MSHIVLIFSSIVLLSVQLVLSVDRSIDMTAVANSCPNDWRSYIGARTRHGLMTVVEAVVSQTPSDDTGHDERSRKSVLSAITSEANKQRKRINLDQLRTMRESIGVLIFIMLVVRAVQLFFAGHMQVQLVSRCELTEVGQM